MSSVSTNSFKFPESVTHLPPTQAGSGNLNKIGRFNLLGSLHRAQAAYSSKSGKFEEDSFLRGMGEFLLTFFYGEVL
jgi:hypothetical protein